MSAILATNFSIKTEVFEGPLELLLDLVEKRKLLINDISLADVTDEYMKEVRLMQELSLPNTAQFVALASTLLLIKSKSLLPILELTDEEELIIEDLEERLRRYQIFRDASQTLQALFGKTCLYNPQFTPPLDSLFVPDAHCTVEVLNNAMRNILSALPKAVTKPVVKVKTVVTLEEMMKRLQNRIRNRLQTNFSELCAGETEKRVIIVGFLAILELFKQGNLIIEQENRFSDIRIEQDKGGAPTYY
jgi:segregation and condensation protein A